jgi:hypothetical protein
MIRFSYYRLTVTVLFLWGALNNERTGLSFAYAAGPCQRGLPRDSGPCFTVSDLRLPFSSPLTARKVSLTPVSLINIQSVRRKTQLPSKLRDAVFTEALLGNAAESCLKKQVRFGSVRFGSV